VLNNLLSAFCDEKAGKAIKVMRKGGHVMILDHSTLEQGYGPFKNT